MKSSLLLCLGFVFALSACRVNKNASQTESASNMILQGFTNQIGDGIVFHANPQIAQNYVSKLIKFSLGYTSENTECFDDDIDFRNGTLQVCVGGQWLPQDRFSKGSNILKEMLVKAGVEEILVSNTQVYFIDTNIVNAFAVRVKGDDNQAHAIIAVYSGILPTMSNDSQLAGALTHEFGHNLRFSNKSADGAEATRRKIRDLCRSRELEDCNAAMASFVRGEEVEADRVIAITPANLIQRISKGEQSRFYFNNFLVTDWFKARDRGPVDMYATHPRGNDRARFIESKLVELGVHQPANKDLDYKTDRTYIKKLLQSVGKAE